MREATTASLATAGLSRAFGGVAAVRDLSFEVRPGELYGLVGPDGAGKTTTIRMVTGLVRPDAGEAYVLGRPVRAGDGAARAVVGYLPQRYSLYGDLSVDENLTFFGRLFGLSRRDLAARAAELLAITRLARFRGRRADDLSGGMYKKLALACALLHRPRVLVLDEPSNGVDPVSRRELWDLLHGFVADGMAVLIATPYMDEAARCHRVGLLRDGALLAEGPPDELVASSPHVTLRLTVGGADRAALEASLEARPEVLALSPHGADLRVVVHGERRGSFDLWAAANALVATPVTPDFEDVYLGLLALADVAPASPSAPALTGIAS